jgi:hypothetical protein
MIDDLEKTEMLMERMGAALPMRARVSTDALQVLRDKSPETDFSRQCHVTDLRYAGDEGGILCHLDFGVHGSKSMQIVSITHLAFDRKNPLWREIEGYKKRRIKRLRKLHGRGF